MQLLSYARDTCYWHQSPHIIKGWTNFALGGSSTYRFNSWRSVSNPPRPGTVFCLLLRVSSDYAQPITGQVTEVTWPVIGRAQPELTRTKRQKTGPDNSHQPRNNILLFIARFKQSKAYRDPSHLCFCNFTQILCISNHCTTFSKYQKDIKVCCARAEFRNRRLITMLRYGLEENLYFSRIW